MTRRGLLGAAAAILVGLVGLGATVHAAAGPEHGAADCVACALCDWLNALFS